MPLFPAIGAALKIGGKALGAIVSKAKAKRAEKKALKLQKRASEKELDLNAMGIKFGLIQPARLTTGDISNVKRFVKGEKAMDKALPPSEPVKSNWKIIIPIFAAVILILFFVFYRET